MLEVLGAVLERAAGLNAEAIAQTGAESPCDGRAVLASALRENRDAMTLATARVLAAVWEEAFAEGRAFERKVSPLPSALPPPSAPQERLRLVARA